MVNAYWQGMSEYHYLFLYLFNQPKLSVFTAVLGVDVVDEPEVGGNKNSYIMTALPDINHHINIWVTTIICCWVCILSQDEWVRIYYCSYTWFHTSYFNLLTELYTLQIVCYLTCTGVFIRMSTEELHWIFVHCCTLCNDNKGVLFCSFLSRQLCCFVKLQSWWQVDLWALTQFTQWIVMLVKRTLSLFHIRYSFNCYLVKPIIYTSCLLHK